MAIGDRFWTEYLVESISMNPVGVHGSVGVTTSGTTLTAPAGARRLLFQPTSGTLRFKLVGTASSSDGFIFVSGAVPYALMLGPDSSPSFASSVGTVSLAYQWME